MQSSHSLRLDLTVLDGPLNSADGSAKPGRVTEGRHKQDRVDQSGSIVCGAQTIEMPEQSSGANAAWLVDSGVNYDSIWDVNVARENLECRKNHHRCWSVLPGGYAKIHNHGDKCGELGHMSWSMPVRAEFHMLLLA